MRRREFISLLVGTTAWPLAVLAQQPGRVYRIGGLHQSPANSPHHLAFFADLQTFGFVEGQNLAIEWRGYGQPAERLAELAKGQAAAQVDVIVCSGEAAARAAQRATGTIPLVVLVDELAREGAKRHSHLSLIFAIVAI